MSEEDLVQLKIRQWLAEQARLSVAEVADCGVLLGYGFDSVAALEFLLFVETEFGLEITENDAEFLRVTTVAELIALIVARLRTA